MGNLGSEQPTGRRMRLFRLCSCKLQGRVQVGVAPEQNQTSSSPSSRRRAEQVHVLKLHRRTPAGPRPSLLTFALVGWACMEREGGGDT